DLRMPGQIGDVLVPGNGPEPRPAVAAAIRVPVHRRVLAQPGELVVGRSAALVDVGVDEVDRRNHIASVRVRLPRTSTIRPGPPQVGLRSRKNRLGPNWILASLTWAIRSAAKIVRPGSAFLS